MIPNKCAHSRAVIDAPTDVWNGAMPVEASVMNTRPESVIMLFTGGVIGPLTGMVTGRLAGGMASICTDMLTEVGMTVVFVATNSLERVASISCAVEARTGGVDVSIVVRIVVMVDFLIDALARTLNDAVPDIGASADVDANTWVAVIKLPAS